MRAWHPPKLAVAAWFDGEGTDADGAHIARCSRCQRHVSELARVRSWIRAQPFVAMTGELEPLAAPPDRRRWRPLAVVTALLLAFVLVRGGDAERVGTPRSAAPPAAGDAPYTVPDGAPGSPADGPALPGLDGPGGPSLLDGPMLKEGGEATTGERRAPATAAGQASAPLRLGLVVPTTGPLADDGAEVTTVVRRRVDAANAAGGVAGVPVELVVAPAENVEAVRAMAGSVSALVGGFGVAPPPGTLWLFPADPTVAGPEVVPAEASPRLAGAQLGATLRRQGLTGPVGVVVGSGPDTALAAGLSSKVPTTVVAARSDRSCTVEVTSLRRSGAQALAVAGEPSLAAACLQAAARLAWHPAFGTVVAPSAAYGRVETVPEATGTRTVLALPWPTSLTAGAARFRANTQSTSYRALVSYAATELAIDVARQQGTLSLPSLAAGNWRTDLVDLTGTTSRAGGVVVAFLGSWLAAGT